MLGNRHSYRDRRHDDPQGNPVSAWQHRYGEPGSGNRRVSKAPMP